MVIKILCFVLASIIVAQATSTRLFIREEMEQKRDLLKVAGDLIDVGKNAFAGLSKAGEHLIESGGEILETGGKIIKGATDLATAGIGGFIPNIFGLGKRESDTA